MEADDSEIKNWDYGKASQKISYLQLERETGQNNKINFRSRKKFEQHIRNLYTQLYNCENNLKKSNIKADRLT